MPSAGAARGRVSVEKFIVAKKMAAQEFLPKQPPPSSAFRAFTIATSPEHNIVGVGVGRKIVKGKATPQTAIRFYVERKLDKSAIPPSAMLPRDYQGFKTDVIEAGRFLAFMHPRAAAAAA